MRRTTCTRLEQEPIRLQQIDERPLVTELVVWAHYSIPSTVVGWLEAGSFQIRSCICVGCRNVTDVPILA